MNKGSTPLTKRARGRAEHRGSAAPDDVMLPIKPCLSSMASRMELMSLLSSLSYLAVLLSCLRVLHWPESCSSCLPAALGVSLLPE